VMYMHCNKLNVNNQSSTPSVVIGCKMEVLTSDVSKTSMMMSSSN
jgi:hypothetical protein